jgi:integrase
VDKKQQDQQRRMNTGAHLQRAGKAMERGHVNIVLRAALQDATEQDPPLLRKNPASKAFSYSRQKNRVEMKTWTAAQVQQFLDFVAIDREAAFFRVALMMGMRRGELLGLRRRDLDLDNARLKVRQQVCKKGAHGLEFKGLKTGTKAWRTIKLDPATVEQLRTGLEVLASATIAPRRRMEFRRSRRRSDKCLRRTMSTTASLLRFAD